MSVRYQRRRFLRDQMPALREGERCAAMRLYPAGNEQLYALGQEVLHAHETVHFGSAPSMRQHFAKARAKYGHIAQEQGRHDVRL